MKLVKLILTLVAVVWVAGTVLGFFGKDIATTVQANAKDVKGLQTASNISKYSVLVKTWAPWEWFFNLIGQGAGTQNALDTNKKPFDLNKAADGTLKFFNDMGDKSPQFREAVTKNINGPNITALALLIFFIMVVVSLIRGTFFTNAGQLGKAAAATVTTLKGFGTLTALAGMGIFGYQVVQQGFNFITNSLWNLLPVVAPVIVGIYYLNKNWKTIVGGAAVVFVVIVVAKIGTGYLNPSAASDMTVTIPTREWAQSIGGIIESVNGDTIKMVTSLALMALGGVLQKKATSTAKGSPVVIKGG